MNAPTEKPEIEALLCDAEVEAERLVSIARIAVALGLLIFFAIAFPPIEEVEHAVLIRQGYAALAMMLAYLLIGVLIWLAIRTRMFHRRMIWPAAVADSLFAVFSMKASMDKTYLSGDAVFVFPSVWLVPLVLSFGVLRGNPRVLAVHVSVLVAGIAIIVAADAGAIKGQGDSVIWLFLGPPPNVMRLIMIALAGVILVVAARRTRLLLFQSIDATIRNVNLTRYLPAELAPQLAAGRLEDLREGQREEIAVLFIDIRGFTQLSETMTPREVSDFVTEFRRLVARVVEDNDGVIDKFMGDAAIVLFTEPDRPQQAAMNGLNCAVALNATMQEWSTARTRSHNAPIDAGIGLHFGALFSGVVGDETRLEYSVFGDTVNVAARLQEMSKQLRSPVLASGETVNAADATGWHQIAQTPLRGRQGPTDIMAPNGKAGSDPEKRLQ
ncbi:MAG: adenylate/guanylate cyclase domain-containing protein [Paracoccaceae bacterium]